MIKGGGLAFFALDVVSCFGVFVLSAAEARRASGEARTYRSRSTARFRGRSS